MPQSFLSVHGIGKGKLDNILILRKRGEAPRDKQVETQIKNINFLNRQE
jgi:hypothetical protein